MNRDEKRAILVVSFGTSYESARKATIEAIEREMGEAFPDCGIYRAWTSKMIIAKLKKRDGLYIDTVKEAMERMAADGVTDVTVQPTHVINGIENDLMKQDALSCREKFRSLSFGDPLLTSEEDNETVARAIAEEFSGLSGEDALVLMGHGTPHYSNAIYAALNYRFRDMGCPNIFLGTVEAYPSIQSLLRTVRAFSPRRVILAPFMIVAGDHAANDMAGDDPGSWLRLFQKEGYEVVPILKGLGEYEGIRRLLIRHAKEAAARC